MCRDKKVIFHQVVSYMSSELSNKLTTCSVVVVIMSVTVLTQYQIRHYIQLKYCNGNNCRSGKK